MVGAVYNILIIAVSSDKLLQEICSHWNKDLNMVFKM